MDIKDFKSNFEAIKKSLAILPQQKSKLLSAQSQTLKILFFDSSEEVDEIKKEEAAASFKEESKKHGELAPMEESLNTMDKLGG